MSLQIWIVIAVALAVLAVLVMGLTLMVSGGKMNAKYGHKLMMARVGLQALVLVLMLLFFALRSA